MWLDHNDVFTPVNTPQHEQVLDKRCRWKIIHQIDQKCRSQKNGDVDGMCKRNLMCVWRNAYWWSLCLCRSSSWRLYPFRFPRQRVDQSGASHDARSAPLLHFHLVPARDPDAQRSWTRPARSLPICYNLRSLWRMSSRFGSSKNTVAGR